MTMLTIAKRGSLAAGMLVGSVMSVSASSLLLDFTDLPLTGSLGDVTYTVTSVGGTLTTNAPGPGNVPEIAPLQGDGDGLGVDDDEITDATKMPEAIVVTFSKLVKFSKLYFLDLFQNRDTGMPETAFVYAGAGTGGPLLGTFEAQVPFQDKHGFGEFDVDFEFGQVFTFAAGEDNDGVGLGDYALAGIELTPIPLPAGALLLGTALACLGFARRRRA